MVEDKTIFVIRGAEGLLNSRQNEKFQIQDEQPLYEDVDGASQQIYDDTGTPAPDWIPLFALRITTDHQPKDNSVGFMIGRNAGKCDILLNDHRVSEEQFAVQLRLDTGTVLLKNYSRHGTQVTFSRQRQINLMKSPHVLLNFEMASIDLSSSLRIQIQRYDNPVNWDEFRKRLLQSHSRLGSARLQLGNNIESTNASSRPPVYIKGRRLGQGGFAEVFEAIEQYTGDIYAMKLYKPGKTRWKEHAMLERLRHDHVVRYIAYMHLPGQPPQLIMEYVKGPNLQDFLDPSKGHPPLVMPEIRDLLRQLLEAVAYLHNQNVTHRDIKPANIILLGRGPVEAKLVDFGLATDANEFDTFCGSPLYLAPEIINKQGPFTKKVDIFSIGVVALQLFGVSFDVQHRGRSQRPARLYLEAVLEKRRLLSAGSHPLPLHIDLGVRQLADRPNDRPSAQDCLMHVFFRGTHPIDGGETWGSGSRLPPGPRTHTSHHSQGSRHEVHAAGQELSREVADRRSDSRHSAWGYSTEGSLHDSSRRARNDRGQSHSGQHSSSLSGPRHNPTHDSASRSRHSEFARSDAPSPLSSREGHSTRGGHQNRAVVGNSMRGALVINGITIATDNNESYLSISDIFEAAGTTGMTRLRYFNLLQGHGVVVQRAGKSWVPVRDACFLCEVLGLDPQPLFDRVSLSLPLNPTILLENYLFLPTNLPPQYSLLWLRGIGVMFIPESHSVNLTSLLKAYGIVDTWITGYFRKNGHVVKTVDRANLTKGTYVALRDAYSLCLSNGFDTEPVRDIAARCGLVLSG